MRQGFRHDPTRPAGTHIRNCDLEFAQRPQAIKRLEGGHTDQPNSEQQKALHQSAAERFNLLIERYARLGHLKAPPRLGGGQEYIPLHNAQFAILEFITVVEMGAVILMRRVRLKRLIPKRAGSEGFILVAANLPVKARIGLQKALIAHRTVQAHFPIGTNFCRRNHLRQHIF